MKIEYMPLSKLLAMGHPENPKEHRTGDICDSILRFGFTAPPTIDESTGVLVAGHGRCEALEQLRAAGRPDKHEGAWPPTGIKAKGDDWLVPVVRGIAFSSEAERDAYVVADNQLVIAGGWDRRKLAGLVSKFKSRRGVGFDDKQYERLLGAFRVRERSITETTHRPATFWLQIKGPVGSQPDVIEKLRETLSAMPGVEVVGHVEQDE